MGDIKGVNQGEWSFQMMTVHLGCITVNNDRVRVIEMKRQLLALATAVCAFGATAASAATFDFIAIADGASFTDTNNVVRPGGEAGWNTRVGAGVGILDVGSGISVIATGTGTNVNGGETSLEAYFDDDEAGLGVCGNTSGTSSSKGPGQCAPSNDDNVGAMGGSANAGDGTFETLTLTFNHIVEITEILFKAEGHGLFTGNVKINGVDTAIAGGTWVGSIVGSVFDFDYIPVAPGTSPNATNEFYIGYVTASKVPVPAALPLLMVGLGGLGVMGRRKRKTA